MEAVLELPKGTGFFTVSYDINGKINIQRVNTVEFFKTHI